MPADLSQKTATVMYFNNCWFTNVGEAFIDLGSHVLIKQIFGSPVRMVFATDMTEWYIEKNKNIKSIKGLYVKQFFPGWFKNKYSCKAMDLFSLYDTEYLILSGMFACEAFLKTSASNAVMELAKQGMKVIFLGLGGLHYDRKEVEIFTKYLKQVKPYLIMTRDEETFHSYKDNFNCINGLDCGFWVTDAVGNLKGMAKKDYDIVTFNRSKEPAGYKDANWDTTIIRPDHFQYDFHLGKMRNHLMISDSPYDYISLYANARKVYTDLVHATVIALQFGIPVEFYPVDKRAFLFKNLSHMEKNGRELKISNIFLQKQKEKLVKEIQAVIQNG